MSTCRHPGCTNEAPERYPHCSEHEAQHGGDWDWCHREEGLLYCWRWAQAEAVLGRQVFCGRHGGADYEGGGDS